MLSIHKRTFNRSILISKEEFENILTVLKKVDDVNVIDEDNFIDLFSASSNSLDFWFNETDDEAWNNA
ncbi:MAG: hypothetical protein WCQ99_15445 [Pseudomonadota bacterium]